MVWVVDKLVCFCRDLHIPDYQGPTSGGSISDTLSDSWSAKPFGLNLTRSSTLNFVPLFHQPVTMPDFFDKIRDQKVRIYLMDLSIFGGWKL